MGQMLGADPGALRTLAALFGSSSQTLDAQRAQMGVLIHTAPWNGEKADRFRHDWNSRYAGQLAAVAAALKAAQKQLEINAEQQEWASSADPHGAMPFLSVNGAARKVRSVDLEVKHGLSALVHEQKDVFHEEVSVLNEGRHDFMKGATDAVHGVNTARHEVMKGLHDVAYNPVFQKAVTVTGYAGTALSFAATFLAPFPGVDAVVAGAALAVNGAHFAGESLELAEGVKGVSAAGVALDGVGTVFAVSDLKGLTAIGDEAKFTSATGEDVAHLTLGSKVSDIVPTVAKENAQVVQNMITPGLVTEKGIGENVAKAAVVSKMVYNTVNTGYGVDQALNSATSGHPLAAGGNSFLTLLTVASNAGLEAK